jgi:hypothetical protein
VDEGMKSPEARMLASFLRRRGDLGFCILEYPLDVFLDTGMCRRHRSLLTMSQLLSRIDAVCFEGVEELSRGFGGRVVRSSDVGDVVCDALEGSKAVNVVEAKRELNRQVLGDILFDIWVVSTYSPELLGRTRFHVVVGSVGLRKYLEVASRLGVEVHVVGGGQEHFLRDICGERTRSVRILCIEAADATKIESVRDLISDLELKPASTPLKLENADVLIIYEGSKPPRCRYSVRGEAVEIYECNRPVAILICSRKNRSECNYVTLRKETSKPLDWWIQSKDPQSF